MLDKAGITKLLDQVDRIEPFKGSKRFAFDTGNVIVKLEEKKIKGNLLEIGSLKGKTTVFLAQLLKTMGSNKKVIAIDPYLGNESKKNYNMFLSNIKFFSVDNYIDHLYMTSREAYKQLKDYKFSFIFIDGDHSERAVLWDVRSYINCLSKGGIIALDDVYNKAWPGVNTAVTWLIKDQEIKPIRKSVCGRGLYIKRGRRRYSQSRTIDQPVAFPKRTVCEVHREIADEIYTLQLNKIKENKILDLLAEAFDMTKKMNRKLRKYARNYDEGMWKPNNDWEKDIKRRLKRARKK